MQVKHAFVSTKPEQSDPTIIGPNEWNAQHVVIDNTPQYYSADYNFSQQPGGALVVGSNVITLNPIPKGVLAGNYLCISGGTGTNEAVPINSWNSTTGQLIITCAFTHTGAWIISSGSSGIQETINVASATGNGGIINLPSGTVPLCAPIIGQNGVHLIGCGIFVTVLRRTADYGDTFSFTQKVGFSFSHFTVQQDIGYTPGTPGTITNPVTKGSHFLIKGCNTVEFFSVRCETLQKGIQIVGGSCVSILYCQFYGIYDGRSGSPKVTLANINTQCDSVMGIPTYIRIVGCFMGGNNNGTIVTPTNYNGVGAAFGYQIEGCEDLEINGGSTGGCNIHNCLISPNSTSIVCGMIHIMGHKFDSAGTADLCIAPNDTSKNTGVILVENNIFNGELAGQYGISVLDNGVGKPNIVQDLGIYDNTIFGYYQNGIQIADGVGIDIQSNKIYCYNLAKSTDPNAASGITIFGRASHASIKNN